jgi:hypothetical protein
MFIWQVQKCEGGNPAKIVQVARDAGLSHVAVKIADGVYSFPDTVYEGMTVATIEALKNAGFTVWGWHFIYGRDRHNTAERIAAAEAQMAIQRVQTLGLSGFIIDFENTGNPDFTYYGDAEDAEVYMHLLRANLSGIPIAAASHRFPCYHPNLPWEEFMQFCDLAMPQVYWIGGDPAGNLRASWEEYQTRWPYLPYVPLGAAYGEGGWSASPDEITAFLQEVQRLDLPAVTFWSWQHARNDADNSAWPHTELWDAIATFDWPGGGQPEPILEHPLWVIASASLKFRLEPVNNDAYWIDGIVFPIGTHLTGIGNPTAPDGQGYRFQKVRSAQGQQGWVTFSIANEVFLTSRPLTPPPPAGSPQRTVKVSATLGLKFRSQALVDDAFWIDNVVFPPDTLLTAIGDPTEADTQSYRWQYVQTATGQKGWVAYSICGEIYLQDWESPSFFPVPPEDSDRRVVQVTASLGLKFRSQTSTDDAYWVDNTVFLPGQTLIAIANPTATDPQEYRWQYVQTTDGRKGWVAYSIDAEVYLRDVGHTPNTTVWSTARLNVREMPSVQSRRLWTVAGEIPLTVLEDPQTAGVKVGMPGQWLHVRTPGLKEGYVAAEYVHNGQTSDPRLPVPQTPPGESPYIFGLHDPFDRGLFANSGKTGWMLITEEVGANPATACGHRTVYYEWSRAGFGVITRLNHGYRGAGTLPSQAAYSRFVEACGRWVERSIDPLDPQHGCHVWIIGNEMNNPREWPGNQEGVGGDPITPEAYASLFNAAYTAIKAVQPGAIVCPGAVDPYNAVVGDPKDWFTRMLSQITALDGIVLHAYTHGPAPNLITSADTFQDDPLTWQYYNFYAYRTFMDLIPGQWRTVPVFITETDQVEAWHNANDGWVREAYAEIHRWNQSPHHQQIRCLLLYRWQWDQWALEHKPGVLDDFKQTLQSEYRWRSSAGMTEHFVFGAPVIETGPSIAGVAFSVSEVAAAPDDFKRIWGIGPKIETVLRAVGIQSFAQLAVLQPAQIKAWLADVNIRGRAVETWPQQARLLAGDSE